MVKKAAKLFLIFTICTVCCSCKSAKGNLRSPTGEILVTVNNEEILESEISYVYRQYENTNITFDKIVEDSILEILAIQQAANFGITVSEEDIDDSILIFQNQYPNEYREALSTHTIAKLREKLRDRKLYVRVEAYVKKNIINITHKDIEDFLKEKNLEKEFAGYSDDFIKKYLDAELSNYMMREWMNSLKETAEIHYIGWKPDHESKN